MKLLDLMIQEDVKWPEDADFAAQDLPRKMVFFYREIPLKKEVGRVKIKGGDDTGTPFDLGAIAEDWETAIVTKEQYEAAKAKAKSHVHAELIAQYEQDAKVHEKPWELWEYKFRDQWLNTTATPRWRSNASYRRKPEQAVECKRPVLPLTFGKVSIEGHLMQLQTLRKSRDECAAKLAEIENAIVDLAEAVEIKLADLGWE